MNLIKLDKIDEKRLAFSLQEIKKVMNESGNFQWTKEYPNVCDFITDIKNNELYGFFKQENLFGVVALTTGYENHYYVEDNSFKFKKASDNILYIHRLLKFSDVNQSGLGKVFLTSIQCQFGQKYDAIQIDTNIKNIPMQKAIEVSNFIEVGSFTRKNYESPQWKCYEYIYNGSENEEN